MKSAFEYCIASLDQWAGETHKESRKIVTKQDYELFCKEYVFMKLRDISFGKAFCERFDVDHFIISSLPDSSARGFIEKHGYVK